jgi:hypothetical protein
LGFIEELAIFSVTVSLLFGIGLLIGYIRFRSLIKDSRYDSSETKEIEDMIDLKKHIDSGKEV